MEIPVRGDQLLPPIMPNHECRIGSAPRAGICSFWRVTGEDECRFLCYLLAHIGKHPIKRIEELLPLERIWKTPPPRYNQPPRAVWARPD
jgi:hypothetical protein